VLGRTPADPDCQFAAVGAHPIRLALIYTLARRRLTTHDLADHYRHRYFSYRRQTSSQGRGRPDGVLVTFGDHVLSIEIEAISIRTSRGCMSQ
jgi:hypothetical protein